MFCFGFSFKESENFVCKEAGEGRMKGGLMGAESDPFGGVQGFKRMKYSSGAERVGGVGECVRCEAGLMMRGGAT